MTETKKHLSILRYFTVQYNTSDYQVNLIKNIKLKNHGRIINKRMSNYAYNFALFFDHIRFYSPADYNQNNCTFEC